MKLTAPEPMLAGVARAPFTRPGWLFELKYDGFRLLAARAGRTTRLFYRSGLDATAVFPELVAAVSSLGARQLVLDGEVIVAHPDGRPDFDALQARAFGRDRSPTARFMAFDLLELDGRDLRTTPLVARKARLAGLLRDAGRLQLVAHVEREGEALFAGAQRLALEGIVAKRADSHYRPGRTQAWLKVKNVTHARFTIVGVAAPSDASYGLPSFVLASPVDGRPVGRVAVAPDRATEVLAHVPVRSGVAPRSGRGRADVTWLEPLVAAEVRYFAQTTNGQLRGAVFEGFAALD